MFKATTIDNAMIIERVTILPDRAKEVIITTAEKLIKQGFEEGKQRGEKRGEKKAKREDARRMIEEGLEENLIIKITGLSRDEVRRLTP
jgi:predicted transposase/invertase (TIGR01784 family)